MIGCSFSGISALERQIDEMVRAGFSVETGFKPASTPEETAVVEGKG